VAVGASDRQMVALVWLLHQIALVHATPKRHPLDSTI